MKKDERNKLLDEVSTRFSATRSAAENKEIFRTTNEGAMNILIVDDNNEVAIVDGRPVRKRKLYDKNS